MPMVRGTYGYDINVRAIEECAVVDIAFLFIGLPPETLPVNVAAGDHISKIPGLPRYSTASPAHTDGADP